MRFRDFSDDTEITIEEPLDPLSEIAQQGILEDDPYLVPRNPAEIDLSAGELSEEEVAAYDRVIDAAIAAAGGPLTEDDASNN